VIAEYFADLAADEIEDVVPWIEIRTAADLSSTSFEDALDALSTITFVVRVNPVLFLYATRLLLHDYWASPRMDETLGVDEWIVERYDNGKCTGRFHSSGA